MRSQHWQDDVPAALREKWTKEPTDCAGLPVPQMPTSYSMVKNRCANLRLQTTIESYILRARGGHSEKIICIDTRF